MKDQLLGFLNQPNRETYLALRAQLLASEKYQPYSDEVRSAEQLCDEGKFEEAVQTLEEVMPNLLLSPSAHRLLAFLYSKLENKDKEEAAWVMADVCLLGLLATGEGTEEQPYLVTRVSDEYDVLEHLGKSMGLQALVVKDERRFDVITCHDGSECWFEITEPYQRLAKAMETPKEEPGDAVAGL